MLNRQSFLKLSRYRYASHLLLGKKRKLYKEKYQKQKKLLANARKESTYIFGLRLCTKYSLGGFVFYEFLTLPIATKYDLPLINGYDFFGLSLYKKRVDYLPLSKNEQVSGLDSTISLRCDYGLNSVGPYVRMIYHLLERK